MGVDDEIIALRQGQVPDCPWRVWFVFGPPPRWTRRWTAGAGDLAQRVRMVFQPQELFGGVTAFGRAEGHTRSLFNAALTHASVVASGDEALTLTFAPSLTTSLYPATLYTVKLCPARVLPSPAFRVSVPSAANAEPDAKRGQRGGGRARSSSYHTGCLPLIGILLFSADGSTLP